MRRCFTIAIIVISSLVFFGTPDRPGTLLGADEAIPVETDAGEELKLRVLELMDKYRIIGLNYLVVSGNREKGYGCFGYSDKEEKKPMKRTTIFRIASISKPITATALMQLAQKKKCRLDDDISAYLGYRLRNPWHPRKAITLRHLLTHSSGISDGGRYDDFLQASYSTSPPPLRSILQKDGIYYSKKTWKRHAPGKKFTYSNLGYGIIATIVERVSKTRFDLYCKKNIFSPLGIKASFNVDDFEDVNDFAVLYAHYSEEERKREEYSDKNEFEPSMDAYRGIKPGPRDLRGFTPGYNAVVHSPQGGVRASILDLEQFMLAMINKGAHRKGRILQYWAAQYMQKLQWSGFRQNGLFRENGLSFHITRNLVKGKKLVGHSGRAYGFQGMMYFDPLRKDGIIILMNGGDYYSGEKGPLEFHHVETELYRLLHDALLR